MGKIQDFLEKYHLQKLFHRDNLLIMVLAGILLIVITLPLDTKKSEKNQEKYLPEETNVEKPGEYTKLGKYDELNEYAEYLESKLEDALFSMRGIGNVEVMITLETSEELVVEKDEPIKRDNTSEVDKDGGSRNIYQMETGQETVYKIQGDSQMPYVSMTILPRISGVLIVAEGAGIGNNSNNILEIAMALFDVEAHKVKVVAME